MHRRGGHEVGRRATSWDGGIAASSIPSQASVVSAGGACGRCSRPLHHDMPQRVPSGDAIPTQWTAWCCPPSLPSPPIAPWRGSLLAGVLGGVRSNPAIRSCADAATAASRPLIRREQRGKGQALAVWPEGWEQDGMNETPSPKEKQQPHIVLSSLSLWVPSRQGGRVSARFSAVQGFPS